MRKLGIVLVALAAIPCFLLTQVAAQSKSGAEKKNLEAILIKLKVIQSTTSTTVVKTFASVVDPAALEAINKKAVKAGKGIRCSIDLDNKAYVAIVEGKPEGPFHIMAGELIEWRGGPAYSALSSAGLSHDTPHFLMIVGDEVKGFTISILLLSQKNAQRALFEGNSKKEPLICGPYEY